MPTQMMFNPVFGRYILLKRIAKGGMAEIYRAMSYGAEGFKKLLAIKRILPELSKDRQFVEMFINEAKIVANLNHPNIVQIYDFGNIDGLLYHAMEYVHGKNMSEIIQAMESFDLKDTVEPACHIILETLNGLEQAHRQSDSLGQPLHIMHRDMSPSNMIVSYDGEVKIADFGIAKATQTTIHTVGGMVKGKYRYLSPEQARGEPLDQRTDVFSLAICFYEMLTLSDMFADVSGLLILEQVREAHFERPRKRNPAIPKKLEAILLKALSRDRDKRYASATAWRDDLVRFMGGTKMHLSRSYLSEFMKGVFGRVIEAERGQIAQEDQLAEEMRPVTDGPTHPKNLKARGASQDTIQTDEMEGVSDDEAPELSLDPGLNLDTGEEDEPENDEETVRLNMQQLAAKARERGISLDADFDSEMTDPSDEHIPLGGEGDEDRTQSKESTVLSLDYDMDNESTQEVDGLQAVPDLSETLDRHPTPQSMPQFDAEGQVQRPAADPVASRVSRAVIEAVTDPRPEGRPPPAPRPRPSSAPQVSRAVAEAVTDPRPEGRPPPGTPSAPLPDLSGDDPALEAPTILRDGDGSVPPGVPVAKVDRIDQAAAALDAPKQRSPWIYLILGFLGALLGFGVFSLMFYKGGCSGFGGP